MKDLGMRKDSLITVAALSLLACGFLLLVFLPGRRQKADLRRDIAAAEAVIRDVPRRVAELESLQREIDRRRGFLRVHRTIMPPSPDTHALVREISRLASSTGLQVTRLEPLEAVPAETYVRIPYRVSISGEFDDAATFLTGLERHPRMIAIELFSLSSQPRSPRGAVEADLLFAVYASRAAYGDSAEIDESAGPAGSDNDNERPPGTASSET